MRKKFLLIHAVIFLTIRVSMATTYYVSPNGNNSHTGNPANPWKTFAYAATQLQSGDTLRAITGTYYESAYVKIRTSHVTFMADDPENKPIIDFQDHDNPDGNIVEGYGCSHVTWDGIHIYNAGGKGRGAIEATIWNANEDPTPIAGWTFKNFDIYYSYNAAIKIRHCNNVLVENVNMIECAQMNADRKNTNNHPHILLGSYADNVVVRNCKILRGHGEGVGPYIYSSNWIIENCEVADNYAINIYLDTQEGNCIVRNNLIYNTGYYVQGGQSSQVADGIRIANEISDYGGWDAYYDPAQNKVENMKIYNNIIINCNGGIAAFPYAWNGTVGPSELHNSLIANNTIVETTDNKYGIRLSMPGSANNVLNNIVYNTRGIDSGPGYTLQKNYLEDPLFLDGTGFLAENYRLLGGSPCINAGESINEITNDFWKNQRPSGGQHDIGAHEHAYDLVSVPDEKISSFGIYPNPLPNGIDHLSISGSILSTNNKVTIRDMMGKIVLQKVLPGEQTLHINLVNIQAGIYLISLNENKPIRLLRK